jgi:Protein of unknown function (DUF3995)
MTMLALALAVLLILIATLHVYWGIGGIWPGSDPKSCARAVVGFAGIETMPSTAASFAVASMIIAATLVALALGGLFASPFDRVQLAGVALFIGLAFFGRGIAGFTPAWRRLTPEMPFARLDTRYYSPLCLIIGAGFVFLAMEGFAT